MLSDHAAHGNVAPGDRAGAEQRGRFDAIGNYAVPPPAQLLDPFDGDRRGA